MDGGGSNQMLRAIRLGVVGFEARACNGDAKVDAGVTWKREE
jgi:hypothetical protein